MLAGCVCFVFFVAETALAGMLASCSCFVFFVAEAAFSGVLAGCGYLVFGLGFLCSRLYLCGLVCGTDISRACGSNHNCSSCHCHCSSQCSADCDHLTVLLVVVCICVFHFDFSFSILFFSFKGLSLCCDPIITYLPLQYLYKKPVKLKKFF